MVNQALAVLRAAFTHTLNAESGVSVCAGAGVTEWCVAQHLRAQVRLCHAAAQAKAAQRKPQRTGASALARAERRRERSHAVLSVVEDVAGVFESIALAVARPSASADSALERADALARWAVANRHHLPVTGSTTATAAAAAPALEPLSSVTATASFSVGRHTHRWTPDAPVEEFNVAAPTAARVEGAAAADEQVTATLLSQPFGEQARPLPTSTTTAAATTAKATSSTSSTSSAALSAVPFSSTDSKAAAPSADGGSPFFAVSGAQLRPVWALKPNSTSVSVAADTVLDHLPAKRSAIATAFETASMLVRVDTVMRDLR